MKRLISIMAVVIMFTCSIIPSYALDLSELSTDELIQLSASISEEINARTKSVDLKKLPVGHYTIGLGLGIEPNTYVFTNDKEVSARIVYYPNGMGPDGINSKGWMRYEINKNEEVSVSLNDGCILLIQDEVLFKPFTD